LPFFSKILPPFTKANFQTLHHQRRETILGFPYFKGISWMEVKEILPDKSNDYPLAKEVVPVNIPA